MKGGRVNTRAMIRAKFVQVILSCVTIMLERWLWIDCIIAWKVYFGVWPLFLHSWEPFCALDWQRSGMMKMILNERSLLCSNKEKLQVGSTMRQIVLWERNRQSFWDGEYAAGCFDHFRHQQLPWHSFSNLSLSNNESYHFRALSNVATTEP